ncbi:MAG TPA: AraC family transcriptional regulator [Chitinophagaceae bacterium]|nr:AraC family transcriptional regulator [Chitinophagaceae bacterium]
MKIFIKNMVSIRCKMIVRSELEALGVEHLVVELGEVDLLKELSGSQHDKLKVNLLKYGLELMDDKRSMLIEKIKNVIVEMIHYADDLPQTNNSEYISSKVKYDYTYLANLFSEVQGITIEHFIIAHKIEKVKELLVYDELNLTEIADKLHYSSVAHLSSQFKKVTGLTPSHFKKLKEKRRNTLESL